MWKRHPHATKFSFGKGKTDVVLIPLHMKSNKDGVPAGMKNREQEAKTLIEQMDAVKKHFSDEDIVLLGDTNFTKKEEPGIAIIKAAGFRDLNDADQATSIRSEPFDRFFIPNQPEFKDSKQTVFIDDYLKSRMLQVKTDFYPRYSDHFMVTIKVRIMDDDD